MIDYKIDEMPFFSHYTIYLKKYKKIIIENFNKNFRNWWLQTFDEKQRHLHTSRRAT